MEKYNLKKLERVVMFGKGANAQKVKQIMLVPEKTYKNRFESTSKAVKMSYEEVQKYLKKLELNSEKEYAVDLAFDIGIRQVKKKSKSVKIPARVELSISDTVNSRMDNGELSNVYAIYLTEF